MQGMGEMLFTGVTTPEGVRLVAEASRLGFLHVDEIEVGHVPSALAAYCAMTSHSPAWLARRFGCVTWLRAGPARWPRSACA